jgi:RND superfamily putative drug exporter
VLRKLARTCYARRRLVLVGWLVLLFGLVTLNGTVGGKFLDEFSLPGSESQEAFDLLEEHDFGNRAGFGGQVVFEAEQGVDDPAVRRSLEGLFADLQRGIARTEIVSPYSPEGARQISADGTIAYAEINLADRDSDEYREAGETARGLLEEVDVPGVTVALGGDIFLEEIEFSSEGIGFLAAMVILLFAFGSVLAMGLPLLTAMFGIGTGIALVGLAVNVITCRASATRPSP